MVGITFVIAERPLDGPEDEYRRREKRYDKESANGRLRTPHDEPNAGEETKQSLVKRFRTHMAPKARSPDRARNDRERKPENDRTTRSENRRSSRPKT